MDMVSTVISSESQDGSQVCFLPLELVDLVWFVHVHMFLPLRGVFLFCTHDRRLWTAMITSATWHGYKKKRGILTSDDFASFLMSYKNIAVLFCCQ